MKKFHCWLRSLNGEGTNVYEKVIWANASDDLPRVAQDVLPGWFLEAAEPIEQ